MRNYFKELSREYPERKSGSAAAAKVAQAITAQAAALNLKTVTEKIKVFHFQKSILAFCLGSIAAFLIGLYLPLPGLILETVLWLLLLGEVKRPVLAGIKTETAENLVVAIPARSKETQKVVLTAAYDTSLFLSAPLGLKPYWYWGLSLSLGLGIPILQSAGFMLAFDTLKFWSLLPLILLAVFSILPGKTAFSSGLNGCIALLETASILLRFRPSITTIILYFTGSQSLNSGVQNLPVLFKNENPTYGLNLVEQKRAQMGIVVREGFLPQSGSPLLKEILNEVATEKLIPVENIAVSEVTPSYPLLAKKRDVISLTVPTDGSIENIRELIIGLIRKIEH